MQLRKNVVLICGILFLIASCTTATKKVYRPSTGTGYMNASWYGPKFHGRPTSSGERYDMYRFTAAHKELKFGTRLRVTNPDNNRSVVVTVNDRGPFIRGRDLDLSYGAAKKIGLIDKGVGRVRTEYLGRDMRYVKRVPFLPTGASSSLTIQLGAFTDITNANRFKKGLELRYENVSVSAALVRGEKFYRVRIGKFSSLEDAQRVTKKLADEGYTLFITDK